MMDDGKITRHYFRHLHPFILSEIRRDENIRIFVGIRSLGHMIVWNRQDYIRLDVPALNELGSCGEIGWIPFHGAGFGPAIEDGNVVIT